MRKCTVTHVLLLRMATRPHARRKSPNSILSWHNHIRSYWSCFPCDARSDIQNQTHKSAISQLLISLLHFHNTTIFNDRKLKTTTPLPSHRFVYTTYLNQSPQIHNMATAVVPATCCGREGGCICAKEATCSCGKQPAMHCTCEKAETENMTTGARCSCSMVTLPEGPHVHERLR